MYDPDTPKRTSRRIPRVTFAMNFVLALTGMAAVACLVLEYGGFTLSPAQRSLLHAAQTAIVAIFVIDRFVRLGLARRKLQHVRENWIDFTLILLAATILLIAFPFERRILSAGALYVIITQGYILFALVVRGVSVNLRFAGSGIDPTPLLLGSFLFAILSGAGLLMLPAAVQPEYYGGWYFHDALFTATSATCVTGLVILRDTGVGDHFTPFGQAVILILIQVGGLGIMLFGTVLAMVMGRGLSLRGTAALGEMLSSESRGRVGRLAAFVVLVTFALEAVGAILLYPMFAAPQGRDAVSPSTAKAVWDSVFHSISAFCNAGFSTYKDNLMQGANVGQGGWVKPLRLHWQVNGVFAPLIILGGIGFPVLQDCARYIRAALARLIGRLARRAPAAAPDAPRHRISLHSKIALSATVFLIVSGTLALLLVEPPAGPKPHPVEAGTLRLDVNPPPAGDWRQMGTAQRLPHALFHSVSARTAGFNTLNMGELSNAGKLVLCCLMVVGGSPAGTAGGMKTVTAALLMLTTWCAIMRRNGVEVFKRNISAELLRKAVTLAAMYLALVGIVTLLLAVAMRDWNFVDLLFEACSACGTVGLSTGVTPNLNVFGKLVLVVGMFLGRVGPVTLLLAFTTRMRRLAYSYPDENVIVG